MEKSGAAHSWMTWRSAFDIRSTASGMRPAIALAGILHHDNARRWHGQDVVPPDGRQIVKKAADCRIRESLVAQANVERFDGVRQLAGVEPTECVHELGAKPQHEPPRVSSEAPAS